MQTNAASKTKSKVSRQLDGRAGVQDLLRSLLGAAIPLPESNSNFSEDTTCEQVVMDIEVDGERYLLVRMPRMVKSTGALSPREIEIVRMVAAGHPNKIIAVILNISTWTVCTHLRRIFAKLGVGSRAAMVARMLEAGRIPAHGKLLDETSRPTSAHSAFRSSPLASAQSRESGSLRREMIPDHLFSKARR
jgi:DNA-binding CsgD family transcriptional regulator